MLGRVVLQWRRDVFVGSTCAAGTPPCTFVCSRRPTCVCASVCPATPQVCRAAGKSLLIIKNKSFNDKDKLIWKWLKGAATTTAEFAN
jgi:hypothetical protein